MDVPLALKDIGIRHGLMGYKKKVLNVLSSGRRCRTFCVIRDDNVVGCELFFNLFWSKLREGGDLSTNYWKWHFNIKKRLRVCVQLKKYVG